MKDKVALVTGAAGTFGPFICAALQSEGWKVAAAGRTAQSIEGRFWSGKPYPADALLGADLADPKQCETLVKEAESSLGPLSLLVNNATANSSALQPAGLADVSPDYCRRVFDVDLLAAIHLAKAALPSLISNRGQIINIGSVMVSNFGSGSFVYSAAKAALETITKALAYELLPQGVRVNCVRLGWVPGDKFLRPNLAALDAKTAARLRDDVMRQHIEEICQTLPCADGHEAAAVVSFLASPAASFINGAILPADGGYGAAMQRMADSALQRQSRKSGPGVAERWTKNPAAEMAAWARKDAR
jgi:NAD(P)-dependent dehydrogenase (short-subunit alcohol dehydrogenase family)